MSHSMSGDRDRMDQAVSSSYRPCDVEALMKHADGAREPGVFDALEASIAATSWPVDGT
jgi:hypothetical protein